MTKNTQEKRNPLREKFKGLMIIKDIVDLYNNTNALINIPDILLDKVMSLVEAQKGAILLLNASGNRFRLVTAKGFEDNVSEKSFLKDFMGLIGGKALTNAPRNRA